MFYTLVRQGRSTSFPLFPMNTRRVLAVGGVVAGAAAGATALYVAMKPRLRHDLRKKAEKAGQSVREAAVESVS